MNRQILAFAILALVCTQAHAEPQVTDVRKVDAFTAIELAGIMAVEAHIGPTTKVEVKGDADVVKLVSTTVRNGALVIDTPKDFIKNLPRKDVKIDVIVTAPALTRVMISGTGSLSVDGLASKSLTASIPGTGSLRLEGKTEALRLEVAGTGEVRARKLVAGSVEAVIPGTTKASVHATKAFEATVSGTAVMKVHGKPPSVKKHVNGMARIDVP